jgi:hypothetical protein
METRPAAPPPYGDHAPAEKFRLGVVAARDERWRDALNLLTEVAQRAESRGNLPGLFYTCLGVAIARCEGQRRDGLELCRYGMRIQPEEPDNYWNLATLYVMLGRRQAAVRELEAGLELDPGHPRLRELYRRIGVRRRPPLPFLSRQHPLNVVIGQIRHRLEVSAEQRRAREEEEARIRAAPPDRGRSRPLVAPAAAAAAPPAPAARQRPS